MLLDLLLPQRCVACAAGGSLLCDPCRAALPRIRAPLCERCGAPTAWPVRRCVECSGRRLAFASARSALSYETSVRLLVAAWKERGVRQLSRLAAELVAHTLSPPSAPLVTFVPADRQRRLERGHHPAERLAEELGRIWAMPVEPLLERRGASQRQRGLSLAERRRNVRDAFAATQRVPTYVLLIDDVYTSGATANAGASALRKAGARRVEVITFARAVRGYTVSRP